MNMGKLILASGPNELQLTESMELTCALREMGLTGQCLDSGEGRFLTGNRFLQLISFVGCSTNVCLTPRASDDHAFCHLTVKGPFARPRLVRDGKSRPPLCPLCKESLHDLKGCTDGRMIICGSCGRKSRPEDIAWGRGAGYGRIFIEINNVFPGEVRPVPELLMDLGRLTGTEWVYFFIDT